MDLPTHARAVLTGPDLIARRVAGLGSDPQRTWLLRRPRPVRRDFVHTVIDGGADEERWMLLQDDATRQTYVAEVLEREDEPDRQAIWLLGQARNVRESYVADVLDVLDAR